MFFVKTTILWIFCCIGAMYPIVVTGSEGGHHVRCYCNLPACVGTGYMCKSPKGGCYSELMKDLRRARHGCIDEDPTVELKSKCMNSPGRSSGVTAGSGSASGGGSSGTWGSSLLLCCFSDLCNHVDNPLTRVRINDSLSGSSNLNGFSGLAVGTLGGPPAAPAPPATADNPGELWFRAATIAVPICGALILFLLIAMAIRILRTDTLDASHKLNAAYIHHVPGQGQMEQPLMKKLPMHRMASDHFPPPHAPLLLSHSNPLHQGGGERYIIAAKNETNTKLNLATMDQGSAVDAYIIMQHCPQSQVNQSSQSHKPTNLETTNRDININIAPSQQEESTSSSANTKLYEKQRLPPDDKLYDKEAILCWGQAASNINNCPR